MYAITLILILLTGLMLGTEELTIKEPNSKNPDRIITLKKKFQICGDSSEDYFLKSPRSPLWIGEQLLLPDQEQLLLFSVEGHFVKNLYKKGEGPGEWGQTSTISPTPQGFCILSYQPAKLLFFDKELHFQKEIRFDKTQSMLRLAHAGPEGGSVFASEIDFAKIKTGNSAFKSLLKQFDAKGQITETDLSFDYQVYSYVQRNKNSVMVSMESIQPFIYAQLPGSPLLLLACREEYRLELLDLQKKTVTKRLLRSVDRQPWRNQEGRNRPEGAPVRNYFNDISAISSDGISFWVFSSEIDKTKGIRVDLIGTQGEYLDRFWLPLPGLDHPGQLERSPIAISGKSITWVHQDEDDNPIVSIFLMD